jgi:uncharacterized protein
MRPLLILLLALTFKECTPQIHPVYMPGFDFKLFRQTPVRGLADAVETDDSARVRAAVHAEKAALDFQESKFGNSLLTLAAVNNKAVAVKVLLDSGANPNLRSSKYGLTPFLAACGYGGMNRISIEILDNLIKHGGNVNDSEVRVISLPGGLDTQKHTALEFSIYYGTLETVKLLVDNGAKLDIYPRDGPRSLPYIATLNPRFHILRYLLIEKGVPIPDYAVIRNEGDCNEEKISLKQILIEEGPEYYPDKEKERKEIIQYLINKGK